MSAAIWIENTNTVLDDNKKLCLNSGEIIPLAETNRIMFEVEDLSVASPATVSRCGRFTLSRPTCCPIRTTSAAPSEGAALRQLARAAADARRLDPRAARRARRPVRRAADRAAPSGNVAADWRGDAQHHRRHHAAARLAGLPYLPPVGVEPDPEKEKENKEGAPGLVTPFFFMALTWAVRSTCTADSRAKFDAFLKERIKEVGTKVGLPPDASVHDVVFDPATKSWRKWMTIIDPYAIPEKIDFQQDFNSIIVPTSASICYTYLLDALLKGKKHTLIVGATGVAKSVVVTQKLTKLDQKYLGSGPCPNQDPILMSFSAQTGANATQDILDNKFEKRRQGTDKDTGLAYTMWGPMLGKQFCIFVDDFNMPKRETYGAQPPIELMRQMVDMGGWYDRKIFRMKQVVDVTLIGAMGPPGGGRQIMTNRMVRHMHMLTFVDISDDEIGVIFNTICSTFLKSNFGDELMGLSKPIVQATINIYNAALGSLKPTPEKPHYTFNLRDISKTIQGVLMADKRRGREKDDICRVDSEACRVFSDRLINDNDRKWFMSEVKEQVKACFSLQYTKLVSQEDGKPVLRLFVRPTRPSTRRLPRWTSCPRS